MTPANLRRTLAGCLLAFAAVAGYVAAVPSPATPLGVAGWCAGLAVAMAIGVACLVRLTFSIDHPQMPLVSAMPAEGYEALQDVLRELPETLRAADVPVYLVTGGNADAPAAELVRDRAGAPRLILRRDALDDEGLTDAVREALAHGLRLDELGVTQLR